MLHLDSQPFPVAHPVYENGRPHHAEEKYRQAPHLCAILRILRLATEVWTSIEAICSGNLDFDRLFAIVHIPEVRWTLRWTVARSSLGIRVAEVRTCVEILLIAHLVVALFQKLVMLFLVVLCCGASLPRFELSPHLLIALVYFFIVGLFLLLLPPSLP